jgi:hypothetical protein
MMVDKSTKDALRGRGTQNADDQKIANDRSNPKLDDHWPESDWQ